jgi:hypothetical protein
MQDNVNGNAGYEDKGEYSWQECRANKDVLTKLKINPVGKTIQNC